MDFLLAPFAGRRRLGARLGPYEAILVMRDDATELVDFWPVSVL